MNTGAKSHNLRAVLEELLECSQALREALLAERTALAEHNLDTLNQHSDAKKELLLRLEALELQRRQHLNHVGLDHTQDPIVPGLESLWQAVLDTLRGCQEANEVNGTMVRIHQNHTQRALDLLAGRDTRQSVYSEDGLPAAPVPPGEIAKA